MIRVVLCDDHALIRRGIRNTLAECDGIDVIGEADGYPALRELLRQHRADVLVLDLQMHGRGGLDVIASLRHQDNAPRILVVSMFPEDQYALRCLKAGASGYLNKAGDPQELVAAVQAIAAGKRFVTPAVADMLAESLVNPQKESPHQHLSERELQTMLLICAGRKLSEIAEELMLSPKTVSVYRSRVLEKIGVSSNAELTAYAIRNRLL